MDGGGIGHPAWKSETYDTDAAIIVHIATIIYTLDDVTNASILHWNVVKGRV